MNLPNEHSTIEALAPYYERKHVHALKLSMILSAAEGGNDMKITKDNILSSLAILENVEKSMPKVFGGTGRSALAPDFERISTQIERARCPVLESEIIKENFMHVNVEEIAMILGTLEKMKAIKCEGLTNGQKYYTFIEEGIK